MKYNKFFLAAAVIGLIGVNSCSDDWDSHYKEVAPGQGKGSIWHEISTNSELSNFKAVIEACEFDHALNGSQVFTVFAPTNACFSDTQRDSVIALYKEQAAKNVQYKRNDAIKEFVYNHVALYNYSVADDTNDSIMLMNGKYAVLASSSFSGSDFTKSNMLLDNGVLFTLSKVAAYKPNVYEYLRRDEDLSNLADFIYKYSIDTFYASLSVPGEIIDGKTHYLDSVTRQKNEVLQRWMHAELFDEDSVYWYVAPTNEIWDELVAEYETYFQYDTRVKGRDSLMYNQPRKAILLGTAFSQTENPLKNRRDSVLSTNAVRYAYRKLYWGSYRHSYYQWMKPYDEGGIFADAQEIECSNGIVYKAQKWNFDKHNSFMIDLEMESEARASLDSVYTESTRDLTVRTVTTDNPFYDKVSNHSYVELTNKGSGFYKALFNVPQVLSNLKYDAYVVAVPAVAGDTLASDAQRLPCKFRCTVSYHNEQGTEQKFPTTAVFTTDPTKVDSVLIGTYEFPTASVALEDPQVKVLIEDRVSNSMVNKGEAVKTLRMDCIVFKPHVE
ncbi:MAG: fasciclin domain-containing protein [Bacteroidales bacterium]|nr:fasciclin domain-containing protein [Candidatus Liminaster caballi]